MVYTIEMRNHCGGYELTHEYDKGGKYIGTFIQRWDGNVWNKQRVPVLMLGKLGIWQLTSGNIEAVFEQVEREMTNNVSS